MNIDLLIDILKIDSSSGRERNLADQLMQRLAQVPGASLKRFPENSATGAPYNIMLAWGEPEIVFCTHIDTVPPYIAPRVEGDIVRGRGSCDAKGQIFAMLTACLTLAEQGQRNFALLLLYGEETGSHGAKAFCKERGGKVVIVGEPTNNCLVEASKGTKAYEVIITGESCHSGYPEHGISAIERFVDMVNRLRAIAFPADPVLGSTTYNIGMLQSFNPQNVLSDLLSCRIYFRTTFASDAFVQQCMAEMANSYTHVKALGGDTPSHYLTLPGFKTTVAAFGSDAPQLTNFEYKMLCGPGDILVAHRPEEYIKVQDLEGAVENYVKIYYALKDKISQEQ